MIHPILPTILAEDEPTGGLERLFRNAPPQPVD
jgi:hypothetical protein